MAVAVIRSLVDYFKLPLSDGEVNDLAYECELTAHGNPSGVDNAMATYGKPLLFKRGQDGSNNTVNILTPGQPLPIVIGISGRESLTANMVEQVHQAQDRQPTMVDRIFDQIATITDAATDAFSQGKLSELGELMNINHGCLNALQLSTPELEELVFIARNNGAVGAKLTGAGGGGSVVALCPDSQEEVKSAIETAGYHTVSFVVE